MENYTNDDFLNVLIVEARCRKEFINGIFVKANGIPHNYVRSFRMFAVIHRQSTTPSKFTRKSEPTVKNVFRFRFRNTCS